MKKPKAHYVNNKELYAAMVEFKAKVNEAKEAGKESPRIPHYVGECIMKIATHLAYRPNFANYTFRDEMISDGIENCLLYINNFDPTKSQNPFAYFTQIIYFAFIRRIQKEKKHLYTKYAAIEYANIMEKLVMCATNVRMPSFQSHISKFQPNKELIDDLISKYGLQTSMARMKDALGY